MFGASTSSAPILSRGCVGWRAGLRGLRRSARRANEVYPPLATGRAIEQSGRQNTLLELRQVKLSFESPEWSMASSKMVRALNQAAELINDERRLVGLIEVYRRQSTILVTTGAVVDDDGGARLLHEVELDQQDALGVIVDSLKRRIGERRNEIERLLGEIAG
jgi:hypothetical protein